MPNPLIQTFGLSKHYAVGAETVQALKDFTVSIETGEFVAIMGPSGSGKSTCMHLLGCLQSASAGRYLLDGRDVSALDPDGLAETRNTEVGLVFQSFHLMARTTARRNVELPLAYGGTPRRQRRRRAEEALNAVGLGDRLEYLPAQLSGGQMQRVAIARALVNKPRLLLADEPTGALDSQTGTEVLSLFSRLNLEGMTIIIVTHNEEVARCARRILGFRDGRMFADQRRE
jgi:putative ABC transport system ATP-binding protein